MKIHTDNLMIRLGATAIGGLYGCIGVFSLSMSAAAPSLALADRAFWMGVTFVIAALLAVSVSWLVSDLSNIWCIPAKKSKLKRLSKDS